MHSSWFARRGRALVEVCLAFVTVSVAGLVFYAGAGRSAASPSEALRGSLGRVASKMARDAASSASRTLPQPRYFSISTSITIPSPRGTDVVVAPPSSGVARSSETPVFTMLHGMCGTPEDICAFSRALAGPRGFLVCPAGNGACGDAPDWTGDGPARATFVGAARDAAEAALELPRDARRAEVLMGFSRGAFVARDVAYEAKGEWVGLVLMGAATTPDAERLKKAGIRRVVLASGDLDGAHDTMVRAARKLEASGLPARFVSFGRIYHALPEDFAERLGPSLDWVRGQDDEGARKPVEVSASR